MAIEGLSGRPWVLLPGTLCTGQVFDGLMSALGIPDQNQKVLELDRPNVADYHQQLYDISKDAVICGFSLGAIVAAHAADKLKAHSLILFGLNPYADDPAKKAGRLALARDVTAQGGACALKARNLDVFGPQPDVSLSSILEMADETAHLIEAQTQLALDRPGALPSLANAKMPVLCMTGSQDQAAPPSQGQAAANAAPYGRFKRLKGLGHFAVIEDPNACKDAIHYMRIQH